MDLILPVVRLGQMVGSFIRLPSARGGDRLCAKGGDGVHPRRTWYPCGSDNRGQSIVPNTRR